MAEVLLTAGATRNPIDATRYLSSNATGRTAIELALRLGERHSVLMLGSAEACLRAPIEIPTEEFTSTRDLAARMERWCRSRSRGVVIHSAAVGDYECAEPSTAKIPSGQASLTLRLTPTPKIVDRIRGWTPNVFLVSFKAADPSVTAEELESIARAQQRRTDSDLVFANVLGAIERDVLLVDRVGATRFARRPDGLAALQAAVEAAAR